MEDGIHMLDWKHVWEFWPKQPANHRLHIFVKLPGEQSLLFLRTTVSDDDPFLSPSPLIVHTIMSPYLHTLLNYLQFSLNLMLSLLLIYLFFECHLCYVAPWPSIIIHSHCTILVSAILSATISASLSNESDISSGSSISGVQITLDLTAMMQLVACQTTEAHSTSLV